MIQDKTLFVATGRRKTASARVFLKNGSGAITVNGKEIAVYCYSESLLNKALAPLTLLSMKDAVDIKITVSGGGPNGQAEAISHGIARALEKMNSELRKPLKSEKLLTRDGRRREREKPGQPGARKRFQFSKR
jgi:small subunit ribosomal protein S9